MPSEACAKQLAPTALREPDGAMRCWSTFIAALTVGLHRQRASPPEQCANYERRLRDVCFFILCRLDSEIYHTEIYHMPVLPKGCMLSKYTPGNHGEMRGPISYE